MAGATNAKRVRLDSKSVAALEGGLAIGRVIVKCTLTITGNKKQATKVAKSLKGMKSDGCESSWRGEGFRVVETWRARDGRGFRNSSWTCLYVLTTLHSFFHHLYSFSDGETVQLEPPCSCAEAHGHFYYGRRKEPYSRGGYGGSHACTRTSGKALCASAQEQERKRLVEPVSN